MNKYSIIPTEISPGTSVPGDVVPERNPLSLV